MLRKDLKPGTIFKYVVMGKPLDILHYVPPMQNPPAGVSASKAGPDNTNTVLVVAESPDVVSPAHYTADVEPIDAIEAWNLGFRLANVVKYVARAGKKAGVDAKDDLLKARAYLSREIAALEGRRAWE